MRGFSLVELLLAVLIASVAITAGYLLLVFQQGAYGVQHQIIGMQQTARSSLELMAQEIELAGLNVKLTTAGKLAPSFIPIISSAFLPSNEIANVVLTNNDYPLKIVDGDSNSPDIITIVASIHDETNPCRIKKYVHQGDVFIYLSLSGHKIEFGDMIYFGSPGNYEYANVVSSAGGRLKIDTDPKATGSQGCEQDHPGGAEIGEISVISYALDKTSLPCVLRRKVNKGSFQPVAENVMDIQAFCSSKTATVCVEVQTERPDPQYHKNSGYRRVRYSAVVALENSYAQP